MGAVSGKRVLITTRQQWRATTKNEKVQRMMRAATKRAGTARVMVTVMRVAGNKEGKGGKGHDIGNKGGMQQRGQWQQRQEQWQQGWQASNVDKGNGNGNGNNLGNVDGDKAGCVKYSRYLSLQNM
jgi:hypothetical protein